MTTKPEGIARERILQAITALELKRTDALGRFTSVHADYGTISEVAEAQAQIEVIDRDIGLLRQCLNGTLPPEPLMADRQALEGVERELASQKSKADAIRENLSDAARIKELLRTGG